MTLVGKIFAIAITVLSVVFLALSTVVFVTANNWKRKADDAQTKITKLQGDVNKAKTEAEERTRALDAAKKDHDAELATLKNQIAQLETNNKDFQNQVTQNRTIVEQQTQNAKNSLAEAEAMRTETEKLRETLANLQSLTNRYKEAELELQDKVVELDRDLKVAKNNNTDLRKRAALISALREELDLLRAELARPGAASPSLKARTTKLASIINQGLTDENQVKILEGPPKVLQGEVTRVGVKGDYVEISVGSDDGLIPGHKMYVSRTSPRPEYVGEITIQSVEADKALGQVTSTYSGRKPQEGDIVKPKR